MEFAKRQLEKYGWSEGQGLGKNSTGITSALKPKVKLNTAGIGHDPAQEFTYRWWEDAFNSAASNINIEKTKNGIKVETVSEESTEICAVKRSKLKRDKMQYGAFVKRETLTKGGSTVVSEDSDPIKEAESRLPKLPATLNDEQLFQACGGLTAHKAARHGHKLSGKLQRVKEQEEAFLKAYKKERNTYSTVEPTLSENVNDEGITEDELVSKKKKKKKKRKLEEDVSDVRSKKEMRKQIVDIATTDEDGLKTEQDSQEDASANNNLVTNEVEKKKKKKKRKHNKAKEDS